MSDKSMPVYITESSVLLPEPGTEASEIKVYSKRDLKFNILTIEDTLISNKIKNTKLLSKLDRFSHFAIIALQNLFEKVSNLERERIGIFLGNMLGGWNFGQKELFNLHYRGFSRFSPYQATAWFPAAPQGELSILFGIKGFSKTSSGGLFSGLEAAMIAIDALYAGRIDHAIVGVTESLKTEFGLNGIIDIPGIMSKTLGEGCILFLISRTITHKNSIKIQINQKIINDKSPYIFKRNGFIKHIKDYEIFYTSLQPLIDINDSMSMLYGNNSNPLLLDISYSNRSFLIELSKHI